MQTIDSPPPVEPGVHVVPGRKGSWRYGRLHTVTLATRAAEAD